MTLDKRQDFDFTATGQDTPMTCDVRDVGVVAAFNENIGFEIIDGTFGSVFLKRSNPIHTLESRQHRQAMVQRVDGPFFALESCDGSI